MLHYWKALSVSIIIPTIEIFLFQTLPNNNSVICIITVLTLLLHCNVHKESLIKSWDRLVFKRLVWFFRGVEFVSCIVTCAGWKFSVVSHFVLCFLILELNDFLLCVRPLNQQIFDSNYGTKVLCTTLSACCQLLHTLANE